MAERGWWDRRSVWGGLLGYLFGAALGAFGAWVIGWSIQDIVRGSPLSYGGSALGPNIGLAFGALLFLPAAAIGAVLATVWCWGRPGRARVHGIGIAIYLAEIIAATVIVALDVTS